jgi:hypothetical protein
MAIYMPPIPQSIHYIDCVVPACYSSKLQLKHVRFRGSVLWQAIVRSISHLTAVSAVHTELRMNVMKGLPLGE